jgi:2-C-methyl-D-erythritol 4-phosphate cytidylyltransferase
MEKINIIITAGGSGLRMGSDLPKQFLLLQGRPILFWTVEFFASLPVAVDIHVVLPPLYIDFWNELVLKYNMQIPCTITAGGITRFHSVRSALKQIVSGKITAIHDGVRPLVSQEMVLCCFELAQTHPAVIPVMEIGESMRRIDGTGSVSVDRSQYRLVQTPQLFWTDTIKKAYEQSYLPCFTDDASVAERLGVPLFLTKGNLRNVNITTPDDLKLAELLVPPLVEGAVFDPNLPFNGLIERD